MCRKISLLLLLFTFVFCGSAESNDVVESIKPIETSSTTSSTTTTTAQDTTTTTAQDTTTTTAQATHNL